MSRFKSLLLRMGRFYLKNPVKLTILGLYLLAVILTGTVIGRVTDADTGEPIVGAVVASRWEWILPLPPEGDSVWDYTETVSRKGGWFVICQPTLLIFSYPRVTVYSDDYVVWSNDRHYVNKNIRHSDGMNYSYDDRETPPYRFWMDVSLAPWEEGMSHCVQKDYLRDVGGGTKLMSEARDAEQLLCISERRKNRLLEEIRIIEGEKP